MNLNNLKQDALALFHTKTVTVLGIYYSIRLFQPAVDHLFAGGVANVLMGLALGYVSLRMLSYFYNKLSYTG